MTDALENARAALNDWKFHNRGLMQSGTTWPKELAALHDLIAEHDRLTERLAVHQKLGLAAIFLADTFDEGSDPDSEMSKIRDEWVEAKIAERLTAPPTEDEREALDREEAERRVAESRQLAGFPDDIAAWWVAGFIKGAEHGRKVTS